MADLNALNATDAIKIAGADASGLETNFVNASATGELYTADVLKGSAVYGAITVGTSAVELKVGGSVLANRKHILFQNTSNKDIYFGFNNSVTTSNGLLISRGSERSFDVTDSLSIWVISGSAGLDCRLAEVS
jgi:hypothetical protein